MVGGEGGYHQFGEVLYDRSSLYPILGMVSVEVVRYRVVWAFSCAWMGWIWVFVLVS
jgi:hypothetical protein